MGILSGSRSFPGNGTQRAFEDDKDILYISLHRHGNGFYPGGDYGALDSAGSGTGRGLCVLAFTLSSARLFRVEGMQD